MKNLLWYLLAGTRGGEMRVKIISLLLSKPLNAKQIADSLKIDYKTARHHLKVLEDNKILTSHGKYGANYFIDSLDKNVFGEIRDRFGKT